MGMNNRTLVSIPRSLYVLLLFAIIVPVLSMYSPLNLNGDTDHAPFIHGVSSGDPLRTAVLIWTRTNNPTSTTILWAVSQVPPSKANDVLFDSPFDPSVVPVASGSSLVDASSDFTVTVDVTGLSPGTYYYYQFQDVDSGNYSDIGRTKTASLDSSVKFAVLSCTCLYCGYMNFYRGIATENSLDGVIHVGDYIYPQIDDTQVNRVPLGICVHPHFNNKDPPAFVGGFPENNTDPTVAQHVASLNCSAPQLHVYRWVHALYHLDPDFRAAKKNHPFIVTLDNHDLSTRGSLFNDARQASYEWVPMRTTFEYRNNLTYISSLREFHFGDNLVHVLMVDDYTTTFNLAQEGLLGDSQYSWLDNVLQENSTDKKWRVITLSKQFMPFTVNGVPSGVDVILSAFFLFDVLCVIACIVVPVIQHRPKPSITVRMHTFHGSDSPRSSPRSSGGKCDNQVIRAYKKSNKCQKVCTWLGIIIFIIWVIGWPITAGLLNYYFNPPNSLKLVDPSKDVWDGHPDERQKLLDHVTMFEHLNLTNNTGNNFFVTGDMHISVLADVFNFDYKSKDLLNYYSDQDRFRYGVEILASSGSRANVDEIVSGITGISPFNPIMDFAMKIVNFVVSHGNKHFAYFEGSKHGFGIITFTKTEARAEIRHYPINQISSDYTVGSSLVVKDGANKWSRV